MESPNSVLNTMTPKRAYVTFLAGAGDYVKGVIALAKSLLRARAAYPFVVAVLDDVPQSHIQLLEMYGCLVRCIQSITPDGSDKVIFAVKYYVINYSKLSIWLFDDYEKMVYLDADILVYDNIDNLFDLPHGRFYAVMDCFCEKSWAHSLQYKVKFCQQCPDRNPWPSCLGPPPPKYFNAGMFVFEPGKKTYEELMAAMRKSTPTLFAEQDLLNNFFNSIFTPLPNIYNLIMPMLWYHPEKVDLNQVKVAHYCAPDFKPWRPYAGSEKYMELDGVKIMTQKWWDVYEDDSLGIPYLMPQAMQVIDQMLSGHHSICNPNSVVSRTGIDVACAEAREKPSAATSRGAPQAA